MTITNRFGKIFLPIVGRTKDNFLKKLWAAVTSEKET
jgi:hypothetical protein